MRRSTTVTSAKRNLKHCERIFLVTCLLATLLLASAALLLSGVKRKHCKSSALLVEHPDSHPKDELEFSQRFRRWETHPDYKDVEVLQLATTLRPVENGKKIVALVEQRNVERALPVFLRALKYVVDAIIVLDDVSTDRSRLVLMQSVLKGVPLELLINMTGPWKRQELRHRQVLLYFGRKVAGTHFVLPDYDEVFSANCATNGLLRRRILELAPGDSLYVPWVEVWKSAKLQRVLPSDPDMNFLTRRQTIIFADDGRVEYNEQSTGSRSLSVSNNTVSANTSIHVLRCPRTLCPTPLRYQGPGSSISHLSSVKYLPQCRIIELRFLNLANVLVKSAWYEALGRISGAEDGVTRGKMLETIFPRPFNSQAPTLAVAVTPVQRSWLHPYESEIQAAYTDVELWRVHDLLRWRQLYGNARFARLPANDQIDLARLRAAVYAASTPTGRVTNLKLISRTKSNGIFVVCADLIRSHDSSRLPALLALLGATSLVAPFDTVDDYPDIRDGFGDGHADFLHEDRSRKTRLLIESSVHEQKSNFCYWAPGVSSLNHAVAVLKLLTQEMNDVDIVFLVAKTAPNVVDNLSPHLASVMSTTFSLATTAGSNLRMIEVREETLGSLAGLSFVCERLLSSSTRSELRFSCADKSFKLLEYAEKHHRAMMMRDDVRGVRRMPPVARLIFSLNVGRSGSRYLASVIGSTALKGVASLHEVPCPEHFCSSGGGLRMQDRRLDGSYAERASVKLGMVRRAVADIVNASHVHISSRTLRTCKSNLFYPRLGNEVTEVNGLVGCTSYVFRDLVYSETNPNFKSWFYDVVLDNLPRQGYAVDVVVLRKYIPAVVKSLLKTGYFSSRDGYNWMETANGVNSLIRPLGRDESLDAYDKVISYVINAEVVTRRIMNTYNGSARFLETRSETLFGLQGALDILRALDLRPSRRTAGIAGTRVDKYGVNGPRQGAKSKAASLAVCERRVDRYLERCAAAGIAMPSDLRHLHRLPGFAYV